MTAMDSFSEEQPSFSSPLIAELKAKYFPRLAPSILSACVNAPLIVLGLHFKSFDAYTHIFFADHYRRGWFDLMEPRWFGGFSVASYPPLIHQLIALLSVPFSVVAGLWGGTAGEIRYRGEAAAYSVLLLIVLAWMPAAVRRFAQIFVPRRAARAAGWLAVALPSVYLTAYSFGQLPTLAASVSLLWAFAEGWKFSRTGRRRDFVSGVLWTGVTAAAHHAVLMFAMVAGSAVALRCAAAARDDRKRALRRLIGWALIGAAFAGIVIWPFVAWSRGYVPQTPIDHLSRHNFLSDWRAAYYFFWPMYGPILLVLPVMLTLLISLRGVPGLSSSDSSPRSARLGMTLLGERIDGKKFIGLRLPWRKRRHWPLLAAALLLFTLGLGGTTPLPPLIFGANWQWLTYDRFSFWAGLALLPFAGLLFHFFRLRITRKVIFNSSNSWTSWQIFLQIAFSLLAAFAAVLARAQPPALDLEAIARFLDDPARRADRYLTFGFGDQLARLSVLTDAATLDGTYFTARAIPELRRSGLGTLDGAIWNPQGVDSLRPLLPLADEWGVRWAFVAHKAYAPVLKDSGWQFAGEVAAGVQLWRNPSASGAPRAAALPNDPAAALWWGTAPLLTLLAALGVSRADSMWKNLPSLAVSLLIVAWPFWYFAPLWMRPQAGVYFTYTSGLLFLFDVFAAMAILAAARKFEGRPAAPLTLPRRGDSLFLAFALVVLFALISVPRSADPYLSLGFVLHLLVAAIVARAAAWTVRQNSITPAAVALGLGLTVQSAIAVLEAATQSTAWLAPLALNWPGGLTAQTVGASVVGLAGGARWLRAYGTTPHPNLLAGYLLLTIAGPLIGYVGSGRKRWLPPLAIGAAGLFLSFSRAGWLAGVAAIWVMLIALPKPDRRRGVIAAAVFIAAAAALAAALGPLFASRVFADQNSPQESFSISDRRVLTQTAINFVAQNPLTGVGAGAFVPTLAANFSITPEPVHDVPLLAMAETGIGGGLAVIAFGLIVLWRMWRARGLGVEAAVFSGSLGGLMVMSLFDHFAWSLSAGRMLLATAVGLWLAYIEPGPKR